MALDLLESIQTYLRQKSPEGLYEILEYESKLELVDVHGRTARLTKRQRVKFLQDYVIAFQDYAWGEGNVLADYKCSPGFEADRYLEGIAGISSSRCARRNSAGMSRTCSSSENCATHSPRKRNGGKSKCRTARARQNSRSCSLRSGIAEAVIIERTRKRATHLAASNFKILADGQQLLSWETIEPRRFETYTLKWTW